MEKKEKISWRIVLTYSDEISSIGSMVSGRDNEISQLSSSFLQTALIFKSFKNYEQLFYCPTIFRWCYGWRYT